MAKLSLTDKTQRMMQLLLSLGNPRIGRALASIGFGQADVDEGWALLRNLREVRFDTPVATTDASALTRLDQWENRWFPIASAAIKRRFPAVHDKLFLNLSQAEGLDVINTVGVLLERIDKLVAATDADSQAALATLRTRGLTDPRLDEARALLKQLSTATTAIPAPTPEDLEAQDRREADFWAWYLEWSSLARSVITDRRLLRTMGFLRPGKKGGGEEGGEEDEDDAPVPGPGPAPAPVPGPAPVR